MDPRHLMKMTNTDRDVGSGPGTALSDVSSGRTSRQLEPVCWFDLSLQCAHSGCQPKIVHKHQVSTPINVGMG